MVFLSGSPFPRISSLLSLFFQRTLAMSSSSSVNTGFAVAYITAPTEEVAKKLAQYEWEGKIEEDGEAMLIVKTRKEKVNEISKWIKENHPYDVPEVISLPIENGHEPYLKWLGEVVPKSS